jgi:hypothetical protein
MKVYVVLEYEPYEYADIVHIFENEEDAYLCTLKVSCDRMTRYIEEHETVKEV